MIQTTEQTTTIKFATGSKGTILTSSKRNILTLQALKTENVAVGVVCDNSDAHDLPKVLLEFNNTNSIDVLITQLQAIKKNIENTQWMNFASAC